MNLDSLLFVIAVVMLGGRVVYYSYSLKNELGFPWCVSYDLQDLSVALNTMTNYHWEKLSH